VKVAEHLAQSLQECSRVQEIIQCSGNAANDSAGGVVREFEIELEQLQSKLDHLKAQVSFSILHHFRELYTPGISNTWLEVGLEVIVCGPQRFTLRGKSLLINSVK